MKFYETYTYLILRRFNINDYMKLILLYFLVHNLFISYCNYNI